MVVQKAIEKIKSMPGVLKAVELTPEDRGNIIDIESKHEGELVPIENEGLKQCLIRDKCIVIFKNKDFRPPPSPTILLITEDGTILGQEIISDDEKEKFKNDESYKMLSEEFVLFKKNVEANKNHHAKEYFILPPIDFPELYEIDEITDVVSSSPSTKTDEYLEKKYDLKVDPKIASIVVGFSIKK
ncbi:hypothetical protein [Methanobrevibacter sp. DSM 116169]|uniref:hypothetical protein n=1 Tax=Methanobrevibacter sp. DSM 116169 TaxID=3242727 RepID=UPI0038FC64F3